VGVGNGVNAGIGVGLEDKVGAVVGTEAGVGICLELVQE
jgi:hypothetical protein